MCVKLNRIRQNIRQKEREVQELYSFKLHNNVTWKLNPLKLIISSVIGKILYIPLFYIFIHI